MPQGKGTYGSEVGRPPKDARSRSETTYAGGGMTGYEVPMYKEGGTLKEKRQARRKERQEKRQDKRESRQEKRQDRRESRQDRRMQRQLKKAEKGKKQYVLKDDVTYKKKGTDLQQQAKKVTTDKETGKKKITPQSVKTKGGEYKIYGKESKKAGNFREAFAKARKAGKKTFEWNNKSYTTQTAEDVAKAKKAKAEAAKPSTSKNVGVKPKGSLAKSPPEPKKFTKTKYPKDVGDIVKNI